LDDFIKKYVDFVTCSSYIHFTFNPNFIVYDKETIILKRCIDWYVNKYNNRDVYSYWNIMNCFTQTLFLENYRKENMVYIIHMMV
jgi:hypothetical protein